MCSQKFHLVVTCIQSKTRAIENSLYFKQMVQYSILREYLLVISGWYSSRGLDFGSQHLHQGISEPRVTSAPEDTISSSGLHRNLFSCAHTYPHTHIPIIENDKMNLLKEWIRGAEKKSTCFIAFIRWNFSMRICIHKVVICLLIVFWLVSLSTVLIPHEFDFAYHWLWFLESSC